jgi:hypothetical protein
MELQMNETLPNQINFAALQMANELTADYGSCKQCILLFIGAEDESQLYNIEISNPGSAKTFGIRHVVRNGNDYTAIDILEGLTVLGGLAWIEQNIDGLLSVISGGLFLIRTVMKATTVELSKEDASVVWSLYKLGGSATEPDLLRTWRSVVAGTGLVDASVTGKKLKARLRNLEDLGCVKFLKDRIVFAEPVEIEA